MRNYLIISIIFFNTQQVFAQPGKIVTITNFENWSDRNYPENFFYNKEFKNAADFGRAHFYKFADFSYSVFDTSAYFAESVFENPFTLTGGTVTSWCNFDSVHFKSWAEFDSVVFQKVPGYYRTAFFKTQFDSDAYFYKATINNGGFDSAHFHQLANFTLARFDSVTFLNTIFDSEAVFDSSKFSDWSSFNDATFYSLSSFFNVDFKTGKPDMSGLADCNFINTQFYDSAFFGSSKFHLTDINNAQFYNYASFYSSRFDTSAFFMNTRFVNATFSRDTISGMIYFDSARMGKKCYFSDLNFGNKGGLSFYKTILPDTLDFYYNNAIPGIINLTEANFTDSAYFKGAKAGYKKHNIDLYKTDISKFKLDYIHFRLYFDPRDEMSNEDKEIVYEGLLTNFKTNGQEESYKLLDIEYRQFRWNNSWASFLPCIPYYWNHFGYDKQFIFLWTFIFVIVFTLVTLFMIEYLNDEVYKVEGIPPSFKNFSSRLWYSFIYTSSVFFRLTLKIENINFEKRSGTVYLIVMYTLGLICLAYMANFVLQK
jgi:uncharacterized protein YjbI with pentapeptide repeats